jgi:putative PEP-CTERM system histidine kinase
VVQILAYFEAHPEPANIETSAAPHAVLLKQLHPSEFPRRENRVCQPLLARGEVIALLLVGDHVGGTPFSAQDFDMLKCVGDHVTASLLNVQLGQKLVQAKEMEAFQTMAAFFVHDLKNAASTLSLMLKNLPVHFADPAFREDALRGISKSVGHINHVIGRLSSLRHELKINPVETDLNEIVNGAVAALDAGTGLGFQKELAPLPRIAVDRDQISKVVTNLVLNASEATGAAGEIRVATSQANGWVILEVRDSGCGMTPEFVQKSLFRPFQSTKKNGLGIGMFQSKMIVEVHGGRISVSSEPGAGTTFQVYLPTKSKG